MGAADLHRSVSELLQESSTELEPEQIVLAISEEINAVPSGFFSANYILNILCRCLEWRVGIFLLEDPFSSSYSPAAGQNIDPTSLRRLHLTGDFLEDTVGRDLLQGKTVRIRADEHEPNNLCAMLSTGLRDDTSCLLIFPIQRKTQTKSVSDTITSRLSGLIMFALPSAAETEHLFDTRILICNLLLPILSDKLILSRPISSNGFKKPVLTFLSKTKMNSRNAVKFSLNAVLDSAESVIPCTNRSLLFHQFSYIISEAVIQFALCAIDSETETIQISIQQKGISPDCVSAGLRIKLMEILPDELGSIINDTISADHG
ncbi:hypothetical protein JCM12856_20930 [Spirochaeta dissipatitropha]